MLPRHRLPAGTAAVDLYRMRRLQVELDGNVTTDLDIAREIHFTIPPAPRCERIS
jgi:hypothetical protein